MARVFITYNAPQDTAAFDKHYAEIHIPLAKKLPGLRAYEVSRGKVLSPAGDSSIHLVAVLHFDNMAAVRAGFMSEEGMAAAADVEANFPKGASILMFEEEEV